MYNYRKALGIIIYLFRSMFKNKHKFLEKFYFVIILTFLTFNIQSNFLTVRLF